MTSQAAVWACGSSLSMKSTVGFEVVSAELIGTIGALTLPSTLGPEVCIFFRKKKKCPCHSISCRLGFKKFISSGINHVAVNPDVLITGQKVLLEPPCLSIVNGTGVATIVNVTALVSSEFTFHPDLHQG